MADRDGGRGLIIEELGLRTLPVAAQRAWRGWDVHYLNSRLTGDLSRRILQSIPIEPLSLESEIAIPLGTHSYDEPLYAAHALIQDLPLGPVLDFLAARYPDVPHARDALMVALTKATATDALGTFLVDAWVRARHYDRAEVRSRTKDETAILGRLGTPATIRTNHQPQIPWDRISRRVSAALHRGEVRTPSPPTASISNRPSEASVLMIFNQGDAYGSLYAYDHLFSPDPASPLFRPNTALISRTGGALAGGGVAAPFPIGGSWQSRRRSAKAILAKLRTVAGSTVPDRVLWILARLCAQIDETAAELRSTYPAARVACLVFEIQVPGYLSLALDVAGIRTVALHERPETAFEHASPIIASTVLAGSTFFADALARSWSTAINVIEPMGMWRTDLLIEAGASPWPALFDPAAVQNRRLIVALPYHVDHDGPRPGDPIATSVQTMEHFLLSMTKVADSHPDCFVIVRAKNAAWVQDPRLASIVSEVRSRGNMAISTDYSRLNESYRLCANAALVIGKANSLVDECLAVGVPAVLHDFTGNSAGSRSRILTYLPREIWAFDEPELMTRVSFALADHGKAYGAWWDPHRSRIYGDLNDGRVRIRSRAYITDLVESVASN